MSFHKLIMTFFYIVGILHILIDIWLICKFPNDDLPDTDNPFILLRHVFSDPVFYLQAMCAIWMVIGIFYFSTFLFLLLVVNRIVYHVTDTKKNEFLYYFITTCIDIIITIIILYVN